MEDCGVIDGDDCDNAGRYHDNNDMSDDDASYGVGEHETSGDEANGGNLSGEYNSSDARTSNWSDMELLEITILMRRGEL